MARYAEKSCDHCHIILPANMLTKITEKREVGRSVSGGRNSSGKGTNYNRTTRHYKYFDTLLCESCHEKLRKRNQASFLIKTILILLGLSLVIFLIQRDSNKSKTPSQNSNEITETIDTTEPTGTQQSIIEQPEVEDERKEVVEPQPVHNAQESTNTEDIENPPESEASKSISNMSTYIKCSSETGSCVPI